MSISSIARQIVIEIGSEYIRAGFGGEASPRCLVRCAFNFTDTTDRIALDLQLHELFHEIFIERLHIKPKMCSVLVIEKMLGTKLLRDSVFTLLFEVFQVQAVSIQPDLYMGLIPSGRFTGVVLNVGESECQSLCFAFGKPLIHTLRVASVGVLHAKRDFHHAMLHSLDNDSNVTSDAAYELFERLACCSDEAFTTAVDPFPESSPSITSSANIDDVTVHPALGLGSRRFIVRSDQRQQCLKSIVTGVSSLGVMHDEYFGASGILISSLDACCVDVRLPVARHIVVTGGGSEIPGLGAAICAHASYLLTHQQRGRVVMSTLSTDNTMVDTMHKVENHRLHAHQSLFNGSLMSWIGGSLFSSLASNSAAYVSMKEVESLRAASAVDALLTAPDWQSLDPDNWSFYRTAIHLQ